MSTPKKSQDTNCVNCKKEKLGDSAEGNWLIAQTTTTTGSQAGVLLILLLTRAALSQFGFWQLLNSAPVRKLCKTMKGPNVQKRWSNTGGNTCSRCFEMFSLVLVGPSYALLYIYTSAHRLTIYTVAVWKQQNNPFVLDITYLFHQSAWQHTNRLPCSHARRTFSHSLGWGTHLYPPLTHFRHTWHFLSRKMAACVSSPERNKSNHCVYSSARPGSSMGCNTSLMLAKHTWKYALNSERLQVEELVLTISDRSFFIPQPQISPRTSKSPGSGNWTIALSICGCPYHRDNPLHPLGGKQR